jgi:hypothetical protein
MVRRRIVKAAASRYVPKRVMVTSSERNIEEERHEKAANRSNDEFLEKCTMRIVKDIEQARIENISPQCKLGRWD